MTLVKYRLVCYHTEELDRLSYLNFFLSNLSQMKEVCRQVVKVVILSVTHSRCTTKTWESCMVIDLLRSAQLELEFFF